MGLTKSGATFGDTQSTLLVAMLQYVFTLVNVGNGAEKMLEMAQWIKLGLAQFNFNVCC
jgi:hypothetical protein